MKRKSSLPPFYFPRYEASLDGDTTHREQDFGYEVIDDQQTEAVNDDDDMDDMAMDAHFPEEFRRRYAGVKGTVLAVLEHRRRADELGTGLAVLENRRREMKCGTTMDSKRSSVLPVYRKQTRFPLTNPSGCDQGKKCSTETLAYRVTSSAIVFVS